ncbi:ATPase family protein associated with various cellular activities (AAA) [Anseongella ginsenosidimutans]|uniref:ATPase family protein associated with various cellular activities (AAA) n=2 Tax=Anseongella ginsenosidimutans TaxID=496056 RepID=A0A4R3KQG3_9SPHI|nr:ATP-binding protein [Anseongella ginsenosidimutans]TCS86231.1 ATPase family protein associated with various cellular activities (AAA) [Anseongella ginsenosidimutans]
MQNANTIIKEKEAFPSSENGKPGSSYLAAALKYLENYAAVWLEAYFQEKAPVFEPPPVPSGQDTSPFARFVKQFKPSKEEMLLVLTALVPHIIPGFFDRMVQRCLPEGGEFPEFGGIKGVNHRAMLPTGETAMFLLAGPDLDERLKFLQLFGEQSGLFKHKVLSLELPPPGEPLLSGRLILEPEFAEVFTTGKVALPRLSTQFPAEHISTQMEWNDLVLSERIWLQIRELENWIKNSETLMSEWGMGKRLKPGYRVLFYGPPGTGKTLTATLLGKYTGKEVFRIDLSMVVSKYIGETEKNLAALFDKAENKGWILFFDEADAIFGKRTGVRDAHDKYANQEVSYLLQRIEAHSGLIILASNFRNNIDEAFIRRFNSIIYFPPPSAEERLRLWQQVFPAAVSLEKDVDLEAIASGYELTGSHILNIVQYICLSALEKGEQRVSMADILRGIQREMEKEGK